MSGDVDEPGRRRRCSFCSRHVGRNNLVGAFPPQALVGEGGGREDLGAPRVGA
jgi:hypothetical protein